MTTRKRRRSSTSNSLDQDENNRPKKRALRARFHEHITTSTSDESIGTSEEFDQFSRKGQASYISFTGYAYSWLRFRKWLSAHHPRQLDETVNFDEGDPTNVFKTIKFPIDKKIVQEYLLYLKDGNNLKKTAKLINGMASESTPKQFINALKKAYKFCTDKEMSK